MTLHLNISYLEAGLNGGLHQEGEDHHVLIGFQFLHALLLLILVLLLCLLTLVPVLPGVVVVELPVQQELVPLCCDGERQSGPGP